MIKLWNQLLEGIHEIHYRKTRLRIPFGRIGMSFLLSLSLVLYLSCSSIVFLSLTVNLYDPMQKLAFVEREEGKWFKTCVNRIASLLFIATASLILAALEYVSSRRVLHQH